jgi:DNA-binding MarR family transcriptional regulator
MKDIIAYILNDTARLYSRDLNMRIRDSGVTALQWRLLVRIANSPGIRQKCLADEIEVEAITLSRMVSRLVDGGLVERHPDSADRRAWKLLLTPYAHTLLKRLQSVVDEQAEIATAGLSTDETAELIDLVKRIRSNLSRRLSKESSTQFNVCVTPKADMLIN